MHSAPAGVGVLGSLHSPFVDQCLARVRALYAPYFKKKKPVSLAAAMWDAVLDNADRRFLCVLAKLPRALAEREAAELAPGDLARLYLAFSRLRAWIGARDAALDRIVGEL